MELSRRLAVKPLKLGEIKIFKLLNAGIKDPATGEYAYNQGANYVGEFTIFDQYEKEPAKARKTLKNVTGSYTKSVEGREYIQEVISDVVFNNRGICIVNHTEPNKLICLTRANENASNPFREKRVTALWEELSVTATRKIEKELLNMEYEAVTLAMTADIKDVMAICEKVTPSIKTQGKDSEDIRHDLRVFAKSNPREVLRNSKNQESRIKILLDDAIHLRTISFLDESRKWIWEDSEIEIVSVEVGKDPDATLIDFMLKNKEASKKLSDYLKKEILAVAE